MKKSAIIKAVILFASVSAPALAGDGVANIFGDLLYKSGGFNHTGVLYNPAAAQVADVSTGRGSHSLELTRSTSGFDWGARRYKGGLSAAQQASIKARIDFYASYNVEYDGNHLNQKGKYFSGNGGYWEFDCVGFTERIFEDIGLNPTPNNFESGWSGWPLTPGEQRGSGNMVAARTLKRTEHSCASGVPLGELQRIDLTSGYSNYTCGNRYQEQCIDDGSFDSYYIESCE